MTGEAEINPTKQSWPHSVLRTALQYGGSALVLYFIFRLLPGRKVWQALGLLPARLWILVLAGYLAAHVAGAMKYRLLLNLGGAEISRQQAARCYSAGLFASLFLPSLIGGDILRMAMALRMGRSRAGVVLGSLMDRITDFTSLALLAGIGALLVPGSLDARGRKIFVVVGAAGFLLAAIAAGIIWFFPVRHISFRLRRKLVRSRRAWQSILRQPGAMVHALSISVGVQVAFIFLNITLAEACGLRLGFRIWLFAWPLAKLSAAVPITQAGIGVREAALAALLLPFGAPAVLAVASGLAWDAVSIAGAICGGAFSLLSRKLWKPDRS
ncbi:MAG: lysylphosphatidylglycerol synthase transmembrane domain-containing protein [Candidatus Acidiferrales bacterium]